MKEQQHRFSISLLHKLLKVSRSGFYRFLRNEDSKSDEQLASMIQVCHQRNFQTYGYRRVKLWLKREKSIIVNAKKLLRIMKKYQLLSLVRRKKQYKSAGIQHFLHPNLLNRQFQAQKKNQKWVTDITYIHTSQGIIYLSVILDLFDRSIITYEMSTSPNSKLVLNNLKSAYKKERVAGELLLHSDQGTQYTSTAYKGLSKSYGITLSMSRKGNCYDNSVIEGFFSILKTESIYRSKPRSFKMARRMVDEYIRFYNTQRLQLKSGQTLLERRNLSA